MKFFKQAAKYGATIPAVLVGASSAQALDTTALLTELGTAATAVDGVITAILVILTALLVFAMVRKAMGK